jgi:Zn-dependent protease with chaperone function
VILSYALRLLCLSLAVSLAVHTAAGAAVTWLAPALVRAAEGVRARQGARLLLAARLLPAAASVFVVLVFCIPSFLWLEPEPAGEQVGAGCLAAALLAAALWSGGLARAAYALVRSLRYSRLCARIGVPTRLAGEAVPVVVVATTQPLAAVTGVLSPRLAISRRVIEALPGEELRVVLGHERAHLAARDNFQRLLLAAAPRLPWARGLDALERSWERQTEWAADDEATGGDALRATALAAALVKVARLGAGPRPSLIEASFCGAARDLESRVDRLLHPQTVNAERPPQARVLTIAAAFTVAASVLGVMFTPQNLASAQQLFERMVH